MAIPNIQGKYWVWTLHYHDELKYEREYPDEAKDYANASGTTYRVTYTVGQEEKCPETGNLHLQCYVEFDREVKLNWLKSAFSQRIHWERRNGNAQQASDYCKKEESRTGAISWEEGELSRSQQGKRSDLHAVMDKIKQGYSMKRLCEDHGVSVIKYAKGIQTVIDLTDAIPKDDVPKRVIILYGPPGTGKSSWARKFLSEMGSFYCPDANNAGALSFESYGDQEWLWLDDLASGALTAQALKLMCDRYPSKLPGRGCSKWSRHSGVLITSNYSIESWYKDEVEARAIRRRAEQIWICEKDIWRYDGGTMRANDKPNPMREFMK